MFFSRKKDTNNSTSEATPTPSARNKPPVPPKRGIFHFGKPREESGALKMNATLSETHIMSHKLEESREPSVLVSETTTTTYSNKNDTPKRKTESRKVAGSPKELDIQGLSLPALASVQVYVRRITLRKNVNGDFGFSIRRVQFPYGNNGELRTIVFAEPSEMRPGPPRPEQLRTGLLPGDQLLEIDGKTVEKMNRDELQETVRSAEQSIVLLVKAVPELAEICMKREAAGDQLMLENVNTSLREDVRDDERYWLIHKGGYSLTRLLGHQDDGKVRIAIGGKELIVDSTDVDRANPEVVDRISDLASLRYLNETSAVHVLRNRYGSNLLYTNGGSQSLIALSTNEPSSSERLVHLFKGCRRGQMPAHVYATAQQVYRNLQMTAQNQNIILTGVTGSGKTTQLRALSEYLASVAGWTKVLTYDRLSSIFGILEALGHASTKFHRDSTRFVKLFGLGFDRAAALKSARIQACLLECDRVMFQSTSDDAESNFHIFYYFYEGVDQSEFERLKLASIDSSVLKGYKNEEDKQRARETWTRFEKALIDNDFEEERVIAVKNVLAAILHLRTAGSTPGSAQRAHFIKASHAQIAADLLGVSVESLTQAAFRGKSATTTTTSTSSLNRFSFTSRGCDGPEALISFGGSLYQELFQSVVDHLNRSLASNSACSWISIFDFPGLTSASSQPCGLNDLVMNYVNERVAELFHDISFVEPQEVYSREQVDVAVEIPLKTPHSLTRLFDEKQHLLTSTDIEKRAVERRGLFAILDEEAMFPGASDDSLLERIFMHLGDDTRLMRRGGKHRQLVIAHGLETQPVTYDLSGWVKQAQPCESAGSVKPLLMKSNLSPIQAMLSTTLSTTSEASRLRRATQAAQLELQAKKAAGGFVANLNGQLDYVFSSLRRARRSCFVHCVQPQSTNNMNIITTTIYQKDIVDVPYVRSQLRSMNIIDSIRANNRGFPERVSFRDFRRRFGCLADESDASLMQTLDDRAAVSAILEKSDVPGHRYRLGISQILLTPEVLNELEDRRELCLSGLIASFQQQCRRHLSSKWMQKRRALETAIRCIQKNGKNYVTVREWSWWRLYARVVPLLAVARADTETREWEVKVRKLEQQISELRVAKTKAEGKAAELESEADRQSHAAAEMSVALEAETQSRVQLERRLQHMTEAAGDTVSRSPSMAKLESAPSDSRMAELRQELAKAKESEEAMRVKTQKAVSQLQDVEAELCDVKARNEILEKKQQRFDVDLTAVETQLKEARLSSEKIQKEKDEQSASVSRKLEELQTLKSENAELRVVISRLKRDAEERVEQSGGADELTQLQMTRRNLETKIREQEDEIDELTETNSIQQQAITRLEMSQERLKNELQREIANRESEIDELRGQYQRRLRNLEDQLADSQEANSQLAKENRVLEARSSQSHMASYQSLDISGGQAKRELKKALALLHDTQCLLAHERENAPSQALIRQLKEQLEDAEAAKLSALKGRHGLESELNEVRAQLEQTLVAKSAAEDKAMALLKEKNGCAGLIVEKDEQLLNLLKKYKCAIQQNHLDHIAIADQSEQIADLERAKVKLQEELHEQMSQNEFLRQSTVEKHKLLLSEHRCKELDAKLELESAHRLRLEANVIRSTEEVELLQDQLTEANTSRDKETEATRKLRKEVLQLQDVIEDYKKRDAESSHKARQVRDELDQIEERNKVLQAEVKLSQRRIDNLQAALNDDLDEDGSEDEFETMEEEDERAGMNIL